MERSGQRLMEALVEREDGTNGANERALCPAVGPGRDDRRNAVAPWAEWPSSDAQIEATFGPPERERIARWILGADLDEAVRRFHWYHVETHHRRGVKVVEGIAEARHLGDFISAGYGR